MEDDKSLLELMMSDVALQDDRYKPGPYWRHPAVVAAKKIKKSGILHFRSNLSGSIGQGFTDALILDPSILWDHGGILRRTLKKIVDFKFIRKYIIDHYTNKIDYYNKQLLLYKQYYVDTSLGERLKSFTKNKSLPDSLVGGSEANIMFRDKPFSLHYLEALSRIYNFSSNVDFSKISSLFEIGGGFGCNVHLLLNLFPNITKVLYLDIPPYLYIGTQYLKHFYGSAVSDYRFFRNSKEIHFGKTNGLEIYAIAPWQLEKTEAKVDCFWNSCSFVEMPEEAVRSYTRHINRVLHDTNSYVCLVMYDKFDPETTLLPEKVVEIVSKYFQIKNIKPEIKVSIDRDYFYYVGSRKAM